MWLTGRLAPDFKTIADFRKNNGAAIRLVCREFILLCKKLNLFADTFVAIDGSKFKAVNNRDRNFTKAKMQRRLQQIDESIERYLGQIARADRQEAAVATDNTHRLEDKITALKTEMKRLKRLEVQMLQAPDHQISLTDPDARSMKTRGTGIVGYNVQTAVDAEHHLIVAHGLGVRLGVRSCNDTFCYPSRFSASPPSFPHACLPPNESLPGRSLESQRALP